MLRVRCFNFCETARLNVQEDTTRNWVRRMTCRHTKRFMVVAQRQHTVIGGLTTLQLLINEIGKIRMQFNWQITT